MAENQINNSDDDPFGTKFVMGGIGENNPVVKGIRSQFGRKLTKDEIKSLQQDPFDFWKRKNDPPR